MEGKFYGMYMNHPSNKHDEWYEEKQRNRESHKKGRSQSTRDCEKSTGSSESGKLSTLFSQMKSSLCTDYGIWQAEITRIIGIYNQSN